IQLAGWPAHLHQFDLPARSEAEMEARVAGRLVAATADAPGLLATARDDDGDAGSDGVAVGGGPLRAGRQGVGGGGLVVEVSQRLALAEQEQVDTAIVVEIARRQAAADPGDAPRGPGSVRDVDQTAILAPDEELGGHGIREERAEILDVAVGRCQVLAPIVVDVEQGDAETKPI